MKLLILTDGITPFVIGGMQKHSYELTKNLAMLGHQITLVHCIYGTAKMPSKEEIADAFGDAARQNIETITLRFPAASWYPGHYVKESYIYSKWIYDKMKERLNTFDFIYAKGFSAWYFLEKKSKGQKMPPVGIKFHGYEMLQKPGNLKMKMHNLILRSPVIWNNRHADYIFSYGGKITEIITGLGIKPEKVIEIPTGIDALWIRSKAGTAPTEKVSFVFIGRYERRKGVEEIQQSLPLLQSSGNWEFHFIGPIPPTVRIKHPRVIYHGSIQNKQEILEILDRCQVLVAPSHSEGMPNVIMEAMARGLAILTTDVGAITSVVSSDNGWFVPPGDVKELTEKLTEIISSDHAEITRRQEVSLNKIRKFRWSEIATQTAERIKQLCESRSYK
jgi:glycosyltransferase involved in cell wall biosynthesis